MPTVHISYNVDSTIPSAEAYTVRFTVIDAQNIDAQIFVFDSAYERFTGVATPYDMRTWPVVKDTNLMSYRQAEVTRSYTTIEDAEHFRAVTIGRINALREAWQLETDGFVDSVIVTIP